MEPKAPSAGEATAPDRTANYGTMLQELVEDMLHVLERLTSIERQVQDQVRATEAIRSELESSGSALTSRHIFEAMAPTIDSLRALALGLDAAAQPVAYGQVTSAAAVLNILMQTLGFQRYEVTPGEAFDPRRMECVGYAEGGQRIVLQAVRPGYVAGETVVRPAGVLIADPTRAGHSSNSGNTDGKKEEL